ncbi:MAG TPA: DUF4062 domain-containing protein [Verrucomicrobiae bacterium]
MANFATRKLQVFVSSTFTDLKEERQAAVEAILMAGHIPAGMELFTAGDESQMEAIKQWIDESDVYLLILGDRYGSLEPATGKSYIHVEYEYAVAKAKPLFACVVDESVIDDRVKLKGKGILELENPPKYKAFRDLVKSKICELWKDPKDIKLAIIKKLAELSRRDDLAGWVRADTQSDVPALADELARLSEENAELRAQLFHEPRMEVMPGFTFDDLKLLLDRRGLTDFFVGLYPAFCGNDAMLHPNPLLSQLLGMGLIQKSGEFSWRATDSGRTFYNLWELNEAKKVLAPIQSAAP